MLCNAGRLLINPLLVLRSLIYKSWRHLLQWDVPQVLHTRRMIIETKTEDSNRENESQETLKRTQGMHHYCRIYFTCTDMFPIIIFEAVGYGKHRSTYFC